MHLVKNNPACLFILYTTDGRLESTSEGTLKGKTADLSCKIKQKVLVL